MFRATIDMIKEQAQKISEITDSVYAVDTFAGEWRLITYDCQGHWTVVTKAETVTKLYHYLLAFIHGMNVMRMHQNINMK